ncbi:MAG: trypsin-like peptidase domain-containing protein [Lachnospiraceae bacterium]|nr:trypsin-like peptidase domain-containing protein [Lachnospiraceae bacterium]
MKREEIIAMWENAEQNKTGLTGEGNGTDPSKQTSSNYVNNGQPMSYGQNAGQTGNYGTGSGPQNYGGQQGYSQQNAWQNPYTNRYNQTYNYTNTQFNAGYPAGGNGGRKKKGVGKKIGIGVLIAALVALVIFGLYEVAQHVPLSGSDKKAVAKIEKQETEQIVPANEDASSATQEDASAGQDAASAGENAQSGSDGQRVATISAPTPVVVSDVTQVVASSMPAIVAIDNNFTQTVNYFGQRYTQEATGSGSGIIVGQNENTLLIATNYHVVEDADSLSVQFVDGEKAEAQLKDSDPDMDLAVIAVPLKDIKNSTMDSIVIATLGDSDSLKLGEPAIAIGNALGQGQSVTVGVISALDREIQISQTETGTFIQTDAAINPGNSGGALLNSAGEVIGINSNKFADTDVEGMGFAIPISVAQPIIDEMMNRELVADEDRGYLGISGTTVPYEYTGIEGVRVRAVTPGSGADAAGLKEDDIIIRMNGESIKSMESLQNKLKYCKAGDKVTLTILRRQNDRYVEVDVDVKLSNGKAAGISSDGQETQQQQQQQQQQQEQQEQQQGGDNGGSYYYFGNGDGGSGFPFSFPFFGNY